MDVVIAMKLHVDPRQFTTDQEGVETYIMNKVHDIIKQSLVSAKGIKLASSGICRPASKTDFALLN